MKKFTHEDMEKLRQHMRSYGGSKGGKVKMSDKAIEIQIKEHKKRSEAAKKKIRLRDEKGRFTKEHEVSVNSKTRMVTIDGVEFPLDDMLWQVILTKKAPDNEYWHKMKDQFDILSDITFYK